METSLPTLWSLLGFAVAASVTPGPNVLMVAASAASHGVRATLPQMLGVTFGFGAMLLLVGLGLAGPLLASPTLHLALKWVAVAWLLWLAWRIGSAPPPGEGPARPPLGFRGAALFQWVNPKAWMIAAAVMPAFTAPGEAVLPQVVLIAAVFVVVSMPCLMVWAGIGTAAAHLLRAPGRLRVFNIVMALLLVASLVPLVR
jgi:threonine/homoserine/homoserine lactone efflux protein